MILRSAENPGDEGPVRFDASDRGDGRQAKGREISARLDSVIRRAHGMRPRSGQDRIGANGGATRRVEGLAHERGLRPERPVMAHAIDRLSKPLRRDLPFRSGTHPPRALRRAGDNLLLAHLRDDDHRHAEVQALAHAVHAAVRDEHRRAAQHVQLRDVRLHDEVGRRRPRLASVMVVPIEMMTWKSWPPNAAKHFR